MKKGGYENPLIPHARMRALYRAMVELRVMGERLPRAERIPRGLEACWVGSALDLQDGDLTSDRAGAALPGFVRGIATRTGSGVVKKAELRAVLEGIRPRFTGNAAERLFCALGAAMALKAADAKGVAVAYVREGELEAAQWKRALTVAADGDLPLLIVAAGAADVPGSCPRVPVIPVDAGDAVAIYRVAQESTLRARAEGGAVVIECVKMGLDPIELLGKQLIAKGIATKTWIAGVETGFRRVFASV